MELVWTVRDSPRTVWAPCVINCALIHGLVCMRPGMAMEFGSAKKNRCWMSGLPTDNPLALFWDCKNSPSLYEMDHKRPCVLALKLFEVNGLGCVKINGLMYKLDLLT